MVWVYAWFIITLAGAAALLIESPALWGAVTLAMLVYSVVAVVRFVVLALSLIRDLRRRERGRRP